MTLARQIRVRISDFSKHSVPVTSLSSGDLCDPSATNHTHTSPTCTPFNLCDVFLFYSIKHCHHSPSVWAVTQRGSERPDLNRVHPRRPLADSPPGDDGPDGHRAEGPAGSRHPDRLAAPWRSTVWIEVITIVSLCFVRT